MTRSSNSELIEPLEDPESLFNRRLAPDQDSDTSVSSDPNLDSSSTSSATMEGGIPQNNELANNEDNKLMCDYDKCTIEDIQTSVPWGDLTGPNFELHASQIRLITDLVKFHGLPSESANRHLSKFLRVSQNLRADDVTQDEIRLRLFPYTLEGRAEEWLASLPPGSITTWAELSNAFLEEYFPPDLTSKLRDDITSFRQNPSESLFEAWTRFKDLLRKCPHHGIPLWQLVQKFYNALDGQSRFAIDTASNGTFSKQRPAEGWTMIETMAKNSQRWNYGRQDFHPLPSNQPIAATPIRSIPQHKGVHQIDEMTAMQARIEALTHQMAQMTKGQSASSPPNNSSFQVNEIMSHLSCEICGNDHYTAECQVEQVDYVNNSFSNNYNPNWAKHPNFRWRNENQNQQGYQGQQLNQNRQYQNRQYSNQQGSNQNFQRQQNPITGSSFPAKQFPAIQGSNQARQDPQSSSSYPTNQKKQIDDSIEKRFQEHEAVARNMQSTLKNLETQMGQIAKLLTERQPGTLPGNTEPNPKESLKAVTTRGGRRTSSPVRPEHDQPSSSSSSSNPILQPMQPMQSASSSEPFLVSDSSSPFPTPDAPNPSSDSFKVNQSSLKRKEPVTPYKPQVPFPQRLKKEKADAQYLKFLEMFKQLHINIPFVEALAQMPK